MTDNRDIKKIILDEIDSAARELENGGAANPVAQGKGIALLLRVVRPLVERETVTEGECLDRMSKCPARSLISGGNGGEATASILIKAIERLSPWALIVGWMAWQLLKAKTGLEL
mgnify:CR=1 FL=1